jgi:hypothetical protein
MDNNRTYPSVRSAGGVRSRAGRGSIGQIGRPGPGLPGLSRLRPRQPMSAPPGVAPPGPVDVTATTTTALASWVAGTPTVTAGAVPGPATAIATWAAQDPAVAAGATVAIAASASAEWAANSPSFGGIVVVPTTDSGYSRTADWATQATGGYQNGPLDYSATLGETATFAAMLPAAGTYKVAITWVEGVNRNPAVGVVVKDGATTVLSTTLDQTVAPGDFTYNGSGFEYLSPALVFSGLSASVVLTVTSGTTYTIADAVYFESTTGAATATPSPATASWTVVAPAVSGGATAAPAASAATWATPTPTVSGGATVATAAASAAWTVNTPAVSTGATATPSPASAAWSAQAPSVSAGSSATANPAAVGLVWFPSVPAISAGAVAGPASAHAAWAVNPVEVIAGIVRSPDPSRGPLTSGAPDPYRGTLSSAQPDPYRGTARDA